MEKRNYYRELDKIIQNQQGEKPTLLLQSCCGPCSSSVLEFLTEHFQVTLFWYNPNLYPEEEFYKRLSTQKELLDKMTFASSVSVIIEPWRHDEYISSVRGLEEEPEGGKRCTQCFQLRLRECALVAKKFDFEYFCSTLTVSRYKNTVLINSIGESVSAEIGVKWLPSDFKKKGGEQRSSELAAFYQLYRQNYCGCEYSLKQRIAFEKSKGQ